MDEKLIIIGNAGCRESIYERMMRDSIEKNMTGMILGGDTTSTSTCSTWDDSLTKESLLDSIHKMEALLKDRPKIPEVFLPRIMGEPDKIHENDALVIKTQIRFPRCNKKKRRVVKKFAKNPNNFRIDPYPKTYYTKDFAFCHPEIANGVRQAFNNDLWSF